MGYSPFVRGVEAGQRVRDARTNTKIKENALRAQTQAEEARRAHMGGDKGALGELVVHSPEGAEQFIGALSKMDEHQRAQTQKSIDAMGTASFFINQGKTPEERARRYEAVRERLPEDVAKEMPKKFDQDFVDFNFARSAELADLFDVWAQQQGRAEQHGYRMEEAGVERARDVADQRIERAHEEQDAEAEQRRKVELEAVKTDEQIRQERETAGLGANVLETSESNSIRSAAAALYGGRYNPETGEFAFTDPKMATRSNEVAARAEQILAAAKAAGQPIGTNEAVQQALTEVQSAPPTGEQGAESGGEGAPVRLRFDPQLGRIVE